MSTPPARPPLPPHPTHPAPGSQPRPRSWQRTGATPRRPSPVSPPPGSARAVRWAGRLRLPGSLRSRLTAVYGGLFLIAGSVLLAITYGLVARQISGRESALPRIEGLREGAARLRQGLGAGESPLRAVREAQATERANALHELVTQSAVALGITTLIAVVLGWLVAGRALRPLREITATARSLSTHNLHERINLAGPAGELKDLADTFDGMLGRLSAAFEAQRRFAANASHELRTPLTVQRAAIDVALAHPTEASLKTMGVRLRAATERHEHIIESLLTLARSQTGIDRGRHVDLAAAAEQALAGAAAEIGDRALRVERQLRPAALVGDPVLVERLAVNLVQNAVRHNVDGGWIEVGTGGDGHAATLRVVNSGRVLPQEKAAELFQPFSRMTPDRVAPVRSGFEEGARGDGGRDGTGSWPGAGTAPGAAAGSKAAPGAVPGAGRAAPGPAVRTAPGRAEGDRVPPGSAGPVGAAGLSGRGAVCAGDGSAAGGGGASDAADAPGTAAAGGVRGAATAGDAPEGTGASGTTRVARASGGVRPPAGAGLGLSIVAAIAAAHGGTCTARARAGGGLEVSVSLPPHPRPVRPARPPAPS